MFVVLLIVTSSYSGVEVSGKPGAVHNLFFAEPVALHLWSFSIGQSLFQTGLAPRGNVSGKAAQRMFGDDINNNNPDFWRRAR